MNLIVTTGCINRQSFTLPCPGSELDSLLILYSQLGQVKLRKTIDECKVEGSSVQVNITPEETLLFEPLEKGICQIQGKTKGGTPIVSFVIPFRCTELIEDKGV